MASINRVILIGNLGNNPETRYLPDGTQTVRFSLATTDTWKDKNTREKKEHTEWHRVIMFGKLAEIAAEYTHKGSQLYIEGRLRTQKWTDKQNIERYTTEIIADKMQLLGRKEGGSNSSSAPNADSGFDDPSDDIPF